MNDQTPSNTPIRNEDGHTIDDLKPPFDIPNLTGYLDEATLLALLDLHDETDISLLENAFDLIESAMISIRRIASPDYLNDLWLAITTIWDNSHDLLDADD